MRKSIASGVFGFILLAAGLVLAKDPPNTLKIDHIPGDKGAVQFDHAKHAKEYKKAGGKSIVCKDCHHTLKADAPAAGEEVAPCNSCHVLDTPKQVGGKTAPVLATMKGGKAELKSILTHTTCKDGCHKAMKAEGKSLTACTVCHKK